MVKGENHENHAQFTKPPPLNDIVSELFGGAQFEREVLVTASAETGFANIILIWLYLYNLLKDLVK